MSRRPSVESIGTADPPAGSDAVGDRRTVVAVAALALVTFVTSLSSTVVTNALPVILDALQGTSTQYTWVVTATLLTMTATTPLWGKLADLTGKRMLLQVATGIFLLATVLAGMSQSTGQLIACRALLGVGIGGVQALAMISLAALVPARERGRYGGWFGAAGALAIVGGPLVGGVIADGIGWRWVFYVPVPFTLLVMVLLQVTLNLPAVRRRVRIDYLGATLLVGGVSLLLLWVSFAGKAFGWGSPTSFALVAGGVIALVLAMVVESRAAEPVVPLWLLRARTPVLSIVGSLGAGMAMFGSAVFFGQYYQVARGYTPTHAGVLTVPMMGAVLVSSLVSGRWVTRTGRLKPFVVAGATLVLVGFTMLGFATHSTPLVYVVLASTLIGLGVGATMQNLVLAVQNSVPAGQVGVATSVTTFFRSLGWHDRGRRPGSRARRAGVERSPGRIGRGRTATGSRRRQQFGDLAPAVGGAGGGPGRVRRRSRRGVPVFRRSRAGQLGGGLLHSGGATADDSGTRGTRRSGGDLDGGGLTSGSSDRRRRRAHRHPAARTAALICSGPSGPPCRRTPSGASASATALTTAGGEPIAPPSPMPLNPPAVSDGVSMWPYSMSGTSAAVGSR